MCRAALVTIAGLLLLQALGAVSKPLNGPDVFDQNVFADWSVAGGVDVALEEIQGAAGLEENLIPHHQLRITNSKSEVCDITVKQHSGFLDISDGRHLFFWFFEARNDPQNAPLMLWLNVECGNDTVHNPHSWNEHLNIIYLDEPIGTGYSYSSDGSKVNTLADLAVDVYAFLTIFLKRFPEYVSAPLHIAGESWGGHYVPTIASYVHEKNQEFKYYPRKGMIHVNLASVILANGLTEPYSQFESIPDYKCGGAPYPYLEPESAACGVLRTNRPVCLRMINSCYKFKTKSVCAAATAECWPVMMGTGRDARNPYDIRVDCNRNASVCYPELDDAERWMNLPAVKKALGAPPAAQFKGCNYAVNSEFYLQGQAIHNSAAFLPKLLHNGVRVMVYAGDVDSVCNYIGVELWMTRLQNDFHAEFSEAGNNLWRTKESGYLAGTVRGAGKGAGNYTFVRIFDAGHMAPHDQPEATLDMIERWIHDRPW
ncbi:peptidase S10 serine carboxypeptidase [Cristinia sonorae]|uniref:Peptidase S10 serine carboxypeptidase n=1 Tax=Cristinia sonorae TaxID=1940300 RepID=A0A8K0ULM6_9AGAR|nr:peptidase S10 serine carboxypeptidase [Cristinia sonorae]